MARRKSAANRRNSMIATLVVAVLGIAAICLMFAPVISLKGKLSGTETTVSGFQIMFGAKFASDYIPQALLDLMPKLNFNFVAFLTLLFVAAAILTGLPRFKNLLVRLVPALLFVLGGVFSFLMVTFFPMGIENGKDAMTLINGLYNVTLGWGAIVGGILCVLAALVSAAKALLLK